MKTPLPITRGAIAGARGSVRVLGATRPRAGRNDIQAIAGTAITSARLIPVSESLILRVVRDALIQCRETELRSDIRVAGGCNIIAGRDINITIRVVVESPHGARPQPAGKVARADSRHAGRVSG